MQMVTPRSDRGVGEARGCVCVWGGGGGGGDVVAGGCWSERSGEV